ncbi:phospholipid/cholesterol/gamma-HCH transport system substrate-binding protein [Amycolatopsis arida]|uniref:Phospholipid/cholesterol/gamma-HCH transport system substrate-binding protein n=1 Tax=Amycolatopsis arida TaxID=587909 RepID=A0A1I6A4B1_9PSEU|nr:MCE family protein [Amycolatopsis arida]TDX88629.1 phospholipid/cholesterol/gamma-HCH transport system substrate-binding protein [Amycolatopsis arida]SFQ63443.1 phospholipid/cholesterol/gamma-HCH transport system substrate-binding protein [Amycolatopsis arida]
MMGLRRAVAGVVCAAGLLGVAGCGDFTGIYDIPLPGGADLGDHPYQVTVHFRDVLDLVPQAGVKVNEVPVGRVEHIGLAQDGWTAEVRLLVNGGVELPANALANLRQSSLLGEKYVELAPPPQGRGVGELADGALIPLERTNRNVEVEEVLGALSMLLNGGGVEQLNTITKELNKATRGKEADIKALLRNSEELMRSLDAQSATITRALDGLNRLSSTLNAQRDRIAGALEDLGPGFQVLEEQRGQLVTMLQALRELSGVAVDTVQRSQEDLVANLRTLLPTLRKLAEAGADLPKALEVLLTFPFNDAAVEGVKGDYFNLYAKIDLNLQEILANLGRSRQNPLQDVLPDELSGGVPGRSPDAPPPLPLPDAGGGDPAARASTGSTGSAPPGGQPRPQQTGVAGILGVLAGGAG